MAQKGGQNNKEYINWVNKTTADFTESNQTTLMSKTNNTNHVKGGYKGQNANQYGALQGQQVSNIGEPTATAVTRLTSFDIADTKIKKMQSGIIMNNSSPLGKFNAQSSQIVESNQNIFRIPQN